MPWTFPSKCFEGILEGTIFSLAALYGVLKVDFEGDEVIRALFVHHVFWYTVLVLSGLISFLTVGVSMLNFDYHLSPAVARTCDHSMRYTFIHLVFRAAETCSRIIQIVIFLLAFASCDGIMSAVPYLVLVADYAICVGVLFVVSMDEESKYGVA